MKGKYFIAAGLAVAAFAVYMFTRKKASNNTTIPGGRENSHHHLTNVFSRAKEVAVGDHA